MEKYDYREAMTKDIKDWMRENDIINHAREEGWGRYELFVWLNDELWDNDSITGNGTYGYAPEDKCLGYIAYNIDLALEACREFAVSMETLLERHGEGWASRYIDSTIRCYLLGECIDLAIGELL